MVVAAATEIDPSRRRAELVLRARARRKLDERHAGRKLGKFIERYQPQLRDAPHLAKLDEALDRSMREPLVIILEAPPRHFKTSRIMAHIARVLRHCPGASVAFCTYVQGLAERRSRNVRDLAARAGVWVGELQKSKQRFDPSRAVSFWQTATGGQFIAGGRRGHFVGEGFRFIACDDLLKDQEEALSENARDEAWEVFRMLYARLEPGGTLLLGMQRWHEDDPVGRAKKWLSEDPDAPPHVIITLKAIEDLVTESDESGRERIVDGTPLCPWRYGLDEFRKTLSILGPWFWIQYQQDTTPRGKRVFAEFGRYTAPMREHAFLFISCDPGIKKRDALGANPDAKRKSKRDPAGIVVAYARVAVDGEGVPRIALDVVHAEEVWLEGDDLLDHLEGMQLRGYPGAPVLLEEVSAFQLLETFARRLNPSLQVTACHPRGSKFWRAQPAARAAEHGLIRVPETGDWVAPFCREAREFTGIGGGRDGRVDAMTQLYDFAEQAFGVQAPAVVGGGQSNLPKESPW